MWAWYESYSWIKSIRYGSNCLYTDTSDLAKSGRGTGLHPGLFRLSIFALGWSPLLNGIHIINVNGLGSLQEIFGPINKISEVNICICMACEWVVTAYVEDWQINTSMEILDWRNLIPKLKGKTGKGKRHGFWRVGSKFVFEWMSKVSTALGSPFCDLDRSMDTLGCERLESWIEKMNSSPDLNPTRMLSVGSKSSINQRETGCRILCI